MCSIRKRKLKLVNNISNPITKHIQYYYCTAQIIKSRHLID